MKNDDTFDLQEFLPYLLAMAAEKSSAGFQDIYKGRYGFLRTEWRVLFHLGRYGDMTAREIGDRARIHKTKISRAVSKLETGRYLKRTEVETDRRHAMLRLTPSGHTAYADLAGAAQTYDRNLAACLSEPEVQVLRKCLAQLANLSGTIKQP